MPLHRLIRWKINARGHNKARSTRNGLSEEVDDVGDCCTKGGNLFHVENA